MQMPESKKNIILLQSIDGKKKIEFELKDVVLATVIKNSEVIDKKIVKITNKNKLIMV